MGFKDLYRWLRYPFAFTRQVFVGFQANQGTLLAGAIAYNALLSLVPLVILLLVALSQVVIAELDAELFDHAALSQFGVRTGEKASRKMVKE